MRIVDSIYTAYMLGLVEFATQLMDQGAMLPTNYDPKLIGSCLGAPLPCRKVRNGKAQSGKRQTHPCEMYRGSGKSIDNWCRSVRTASMRRRHRQQIEAHLLDQVHDQATDIVSVSNWFEYCDICDRDGIKPAFEAETRRFDTMCTGYLCEESEYDFGDLD